MVNGTPWVFTERQIEIARQAAEHREELLSPERREFLRLVRLYHAQHLFDSEIAVQLGCSSDQVRMARRKMGLKVNTLPGSMYRSAG